MKKTVFALLTLLLAAAPLSAQDVSSARSPLKNQLGTRAGGHVSSLLQPHASSLVVVVTNVAPGNRFNLKVGEMTVRQFRANASGVARLALHTDAASSANRLRVDPRGKSIRVMRAGTNILRTAIAAPGETWGTRATERAHLRRLAGTGTAEARFGMTSASNRWFKVELAGVTGTNWHVYVNGIHRGPIRTRDGSGEVTFLSTPGTSGAPLLDFDPRGEVVDLAQNDVLMFSGRLAARAKNLTFATPAVFYFSIQSTGVDPDASASAKLRTNRDASRDFSVEIEDVPAGTYELVVNGAVQANITAADADGKIEGEIEFSTFDDNERHLPLTFEPVGANFIIRNGDTVYFQGTLTRSTGLANFTGPLEQRENLVGTGLLPGASGDADFRIRENGRADFDVEIEDIPVGTYELWIGGFHRASISARTVDTTVEGEVEFSNRTEAGHLPLTFDPRGMLLQVKSAQGVIFSHLFGEIGTNAVTGIPLRSELPLFNSGTAPNGFAKARFKRDEDGEREFELEMQNVPAGDYEIVIDDLVQGILTVTSTTGGTWGRLEFDDDPDFGELPLTFDPLGKTIRIRRDAAVYFERFFPAN